MKKSRLLGAVCATVFSLTSMPANSATVAFDFVGSITTKTGVFSGQPTNLVTGSFIYDTSWPKSGTHYFATSNTQYGIEFNIGALSYSSTAYIDESGHDISVTNNTSPNSSQDVFTYTAGGSITLEQSMYFLIELQDTNADALVDTSLPTSLNLQSFDGHNQGVMRMFNNRSLTDELEFDLISLTEATVVPIPPALWLFGSGFLGLVGAARSKVK